jgi:Zn-dependent protease
MADMAIPDLSDGVIWYVVFLYSTICHEAAHAWAAYRLGDRTAYDGGQVSLDPVPHVRREPFGMVVVPILSYLMGGWMLGWASAPYCHDWAERYPKRAAWMAMAGPAANLLLVLGTALGIRLGMALGTLAPGLPWHDSMHVVEGAGGPFWEFIALVLSVVFSLNLLLLTFNLLPVPPLDGSNLPLLFLPPGAAAKYREFMSGGSFHLIGLFVAFKLFGMVYPSIRRVAFEILYLG